MAINNNDIQRLTEIYQKAEEKIIRQIKKLDPNKSYTQNRKILLSNLKQIEKDLLADSKEWTEETVEKNYSTGSNSVIKDLKDFKQPNINVDFSSADKSTISALVSQTNDSFGTTMQGITRTGQRYLDEFTKQATIDSIASDVGAGSGLDKVARNLNEQISSTGITSLIDRGGRKWSMTAYANMLARTTVMTARNDGAKLRLLQNGQRFGKISRHADIDGWDICNEYEDHIVDLADPEIPLPPYHPNCRHIVQFVPPSRLKNAPGASTSLKNAQKFAEGRYAEKVDYSGLKVNTANTLNRTLDNHFKNFNTKPLKKIVVSDQTNGASMLMGRNGELRINKKLFENNAELLKQEASKQTLLSPAQRSSELRKLRQIRSEWSLKLKNATNDTARTFSRKNFDYFNDQILELEAQSNRFTYSKGGFDLVPSVMRHELGHVQAIQNPDIMKEAKELFDKLNPKDLKNLSEYSKFNADEMFAEAFSAYSIKDYGAIPAQMRTIFNKLP